MPALVLASAESHQGHDGISNVVVESSNARTHSYLVLV